jgi:hypothetical protein
MAEKGILGKCVKKCKIMKYIKPNFEHEWSEALRYREFEKMGKDKWLEKASKDFEISNFNSIKEILNNVDLDYDTLEDEKKKRFEKHFKEGEVEIPMVVKFGENDYDLLGGNTRLAGLIGKGINPKLWVVDMTKKKKEEVKETGADSSGSFSGPVFGKSEVVKRPISSIPNLNLSEEEEIKEVTSGDAGQFDVPAFGKTTKGGRKNPLKIDGPKSIYKGRAVTDKNFPKWGGPDSVFVKVKEKCKKFPYCNQGNTGAIEFIHEDDELQESIKEMSKKYGIPHKDVENIVLNEINKIFI